jgi:hypothetical protein
MSSRLMRGVRRAFSWSMAMYEFVVGKDYSREDIHVQCGGNKQAFLPEKNGKIVAALFAQGSQSRRARCHSVQHERIGARVPLFRYGREQTAMPERRLRRGSDTARSRAGGDAACESPVQGS